MQQLIQVDTKVSSNVQTYIPKKVQELLGVGPNTAITWEVRGEKVQVKKKKTMKEWIRDTRGIAKGLWDDYGGGEKWLEKERREGWGE